MKKYLTLMIGVLPASGFKNAVLRFLGHDVHNSSRIGPILILGSPGLKLGLGTSIGPFNVIRNVPFFEMKEHSEIGQWNWISAAPVLVSAAAHREAGRFEIGAHSAVTSRHYFDVSGGVVIGDFSTIAGVRSVFMSHGIDVQDAVLDTAPITIGSYTMVGGCTNFILGAHVPTYSIVAMGSTVVKGLLQTHALYAGTPAKFKKQVDIGKYGDRSFGPLGPRL